MSPLRGLAGPRLKSPLSITLGFGLQALAMSVMRNCGDYTGVRSVKNLLRTKRSRAAGTTYFGTRTLDFIGIRPGTSLASALIGNDDATIDAGATEGTRCAPA